MSEQHGADLVDAITEWVDRADEDLDEHDIEAILRIQLAIDSSRWSGVDAAELTQGDVASLKHHLSEVDAPEFTAWVVNETLASADIVPPRGPARKAPSSRRRPSSKKAKTAPADQAVDDTAGDTAGESAESLVDSDHVETDSDTIDTDLADAEPSEADQADPDLAEDEAEAEATHKDEVAESDDESDPTASDSIDESGESDDAADSDGESEPFLDEGDDGDADDFFVADDAWDELADIDDAPGDEAELTQAGGSFAAALLDGDDDTDAEADTSGGIFAAAISDPAPGGAFAAAATAAPDGDLIDGAVGIGNRSDDFFAALERDTSTSVTGPAPVELLDAPDSLGPAFLPPSQTTEGRGRRIGVIALAAVALVAFVLAGVQLVNNINEPDDDVAVEAEDEGVSDEPSNNEEPESDSDDANSTDLSDEPDDELDDENDEADEEEELTPEEAAARLLATPEPTPEPDLPPAERTAIVLTEAGDVWSIDLFADGFGDPRLVHDSDRHDDAIDVSLLTAGLGVVEDDGDVHVMSRSNPEERVRVWRADRMGEARTIVEGSGVYAVLDETGSVSLFDDNRAATRVSVDTVWDTSVGGTPPARDIDSYIDLIAFAVGDGDVQLVQTSADDYPVFQIWDGETQPRAFNVDIGEDGLFMGVGAGAVARYQWFEDGPPLSAVWDPLAGTRLPAISYSPLDDSTAVVLNNGSVAAIGESGEGPIMWDAEVSDLRAVSVTTLGDEVLLLLDGGTVLRVAGDGETQNRGSIWDVTDESTSPAVKVLITDP